MSVVLVQKSPTVKTFRPNTRFIGRESYLVALQDTLTRSQLVTILGPPGVGKTRLSLEILGKQPGYFCDLSEATDTLGVCAAVAKALGVELGRNQADVVLGNILANRTTEILVLDNFEQLAGSSVNLIKSWCDQAPELRFLLTSREKLGVPEEVLFDIGPLASQEAVELFIDRTKMIQRDYEPTQEELPLIKKLVHHLDCLPLALELAAARMRVVSISQLLRLLKQRFRILSRVPDDQSSRHGTLSRALDWSWELLSPFERSALAQCALFRGGFTLEAAEEVLDLSAYDEAPWVVDVLQSLCDKSLLYCRKDKENENLARFGIYLGIREFAEKKLPETVQEAQMRHARYFLKIGNQVKDQLNGPKIKEVLYWIRTEKENLLVIHQRALEKTPLSEKSATEALQTVRILDGWLLKYGPLSQFIYIANMALGTEKGNEIDRLWVLFYRNCALAGGNPIQQKKHSCFEQIATRAEELKEFCLAGHVLGYLGRECLRLHQYETAKSYLSRSIEFGEKSKDLNIVGLAHQDFGIMYGYTQNLKKARHHIEKALLCHRTQKNYLGEISDLEYLGYIHSENPQQAKEYYNQALSLAQKLKLPQDEFRIRAKLIQRASNEGDLSFVETHAKQVIDFFDSFGYPSEVSPMCTCLGECYWEQGKYSQARPYLERGVLLSSKTQDIYNLCILGGFEAFEGNLERAASLFNEVSTYPLHQKEDSLIQEVLYLCRGHIEVSQGKMSFAAGDTKKAIEQFEKVRNRLNTLQEKGIREDIKAVKRLLEKTLYKAEQEISLLSAVSLDQENSHLLQIDLQDRSFLLTGEEKVSLFRRVVLLRLLECLAKKRLSHPGQEISLEALVAEGWPKERIREQAAKNRLYTAIATLRRLGLKPWLLQQKSGYLLDPKLTVLFVNEKTLQEEQVNHSLSG